MPFFLDAMGLVIARFATTGSQPCRQELVLNAAPPPSSTQAGQVMLLLQSRSGDAEAEAFCRELDKHWMPVKS